MTSLPCACKCGRRVELETQANTLAQLLQKYYAKKISVITGCKAASIFMNDGDFPLPVLNRTAPTSGKKDADWGGEPEVVTFIRQLQKIGYKVQLTERTAGDETNFKAGKPQDFKIVLNPLRK